MLVEKSAIGRTGEPVTMHVEREKIQKLARARADGRPGRVPMRAPAWDLAG